MDVSDSTLPRWLQGIDPGDAPLRVAPAAAAPVSALILDTEAGPRQPPILSVIGVLFLLLVALLTIGARGMASEPGVTVALPPAGPALQAASMPGEASILSPAEAAAVRASIEAELSASSYEGPRPAGIALNAASPADYQRALTCLTQAIYYEAGTESEAGMRAVAQVVINRVRHPDYPNTICGVVFQGPMAAGGGCQFTFTCDGALARRPMASLWARSERYAREALAGRAFGDVGYATHYHTFEVWPRWGRRLTMTNMIGRHLFHRLPGNGGGPGAFTVRYAGHEPVVHGSIPRRADPAASDLQIAAIASDNLPPAPIARASEVASALPNNLPASGPRDALPQSQVRPEFQNSGRWIGG